jgi:Rod binding domain-containing protein
MKRRTLRYAVGLADAAEQMLTRAGREVPDRAEVLAVLLPAARRAADAARRLEWAERVHAQARADALLASEEAAEATQRAVAAWLASAPKAQRRMVEFDPARFVVTLASPRRDQAAALPAPEAS